MVKIKNNVLIFIYLFIIIIIIIIILSSYVVKV